MLPHWLQLFELTYVGSLIGLADYQTKAVYHVHASTRFSIGSEIICATICSAIPQPAEPKKQLFGLLTVYLLHGLQPTDRYRRCSLNIIVKTTNRYFSNNGIAFFCAKSSNWLLANDVLRPQSPYLQSHITTNTWLTPSHINRVI